MAARLRVAESTSIGSRDAKPPEVVYKKSGSWREEPDGSGSIRQFPRDQLHRRSEKGLANVENHTERRYGLIRPGDDRDRRDECRASSRAPRARFP